MYVCICLSAYQFVSLSVCVCQFLSLSESVCLSVCVYLSVCGSVCLSSCVGMYACVSVGLYVCVRAHMCVFAFSVCTQVCMYEQMYVCMKEGSLGAKRNKRTHGCLCVCGCMDGQMDEWMVDGWMVG